ncbi:MAG: 50S ribosomal protein L15 [Dehalococcoidia bacterium]|nr:50S ribosomal protein L15 [Dehalococcoidia bacterium]
MMEHQVAPTPGTRRNRKRLGRGDASGHGSYSGRGMKGQKSRSGRGVRPGFEGGQLPLIKGLPMRRGFTNIFKKQYHLVKLEELNRFPRDSEVVPESLVRAGILRSIKHPVKILGNGEITVPLRVRAHKFTDSAREKIEAVGGRAEAI